MNSMTGYGRASRRDRKFDIEVEVRSVNHRFLALKQNLPDGLSRHEAEIDQAVRARLERGSLNLTVSIKAGGGSRPVLPDLKALRDCHLGLERARKALRLPGAVEMRDLLAVPSLWSVPGAAAASDFWPQVRPLVDEALDALAAARAREGAAIARALRAHLTAVEGHLRRVEERGPASLEAYRRKLDDRIQAILAQKGLEAAPVDVAKEVAMHADRCDVSEEIQRLKTHTAEFRKLTSSKGQIGRRLEFLTQEMGREANTIASKGNDAGISSAAVAIKAELEKIKEQAENLE
jgi:uncharacterized protein (TIGR00255 family)